MPYHRSKKVLFLPYLSFETKKSFLVGGGGGWKVTLVSVCVHFVSVCLKVQKWRQTETKVIFHPPENFFLSQMKGMAKIRLFYSGAMVLILPQWKNITHVIFHIQLFLFFSLQMVLKIIFRNWSFFHVKGGGSRLGAHQAHPRPHFIDTN